MRKIISRELRKKGRQWSDTHRVVGDKGSFKMGRHEEKDNMEDWDEEKLDEVIKKKHGSEKSNATDIVSNIFSARTMH